MIEYFDRYSQSLREERVFGDRWLRRAYETPSGRFFCELLIKRQLVSRLYGWWARRSFTRRQVARFIEEFDIDTGEFADPPDSFGSFNEFFIRHLKPEARPVSPDESTVVFPADGRHLGFPSLEEVDRIFAKGQRFELAELLGDDKWLDRYGKGSAVISRLCPVDYHRFHFPASGVAGQPKLINGVLYSVNPIALRRNIGILSQNKRVLTELETETAGRILLLEIGATNVGSIVQTSQPGPAIKGTEKGYFEFGGSMVVTFFEPGRVQLADDLNADRELYARMGDRLGSIVAA